MMKLLHTNFVIILVVVSLGITCESNSSPSPRPWPEQFHAVLFMNLSSTRLQLSDLWYDWPKGRNVNIFQKQLTGLLYDIEWNNGTSFYYTLGSNEKCWIADFEVGIPRPNFLDGAVYLGTRVTSGFLCNLWQKDEFIWYYEDVVTKNPVRWDFYDGIQSHVMAFEVGAVLPDWVTQAPAYCFTHGQAMDTDKYKLENHLRHRMWPTRELW